MSCDLDASTLISSPHNGGVTYSVSKLPVTTTGCSTLPLCQIKTSKLKECTIDAHKFCIEDYAVLPSVFPLLFDEKLSKKPSKMPDGHAFFGFRINIFSIVCHEYKVRCLKI